MADAATLKISNQKNSCTGQTLHHEATGKLGAVAALARRVHHVLHHGGSEDMPLCDVWQHGTWTSITSSEIVHAVQ